MAVKVVQGLIPPPGTPGSLSAPSSVASAKTTPVSTTLPGAAQSVAASTAAQVAAGQQIAHTDAAVRALRSKSAERKREKLRDEAAAWSLVEHIALSLLSEEEGSKEAHAQMSAEAARYFLTH